MSRKKETPRETVLRRIRERHDRLTELTRSVDHSPGRSDDAMTEPAGVGPMLAASSPVLAAGGLALGIAETFPVEG